MLVVVTGISHKTASLELRERLALDEDEALRWRAGCWTDGVGRRGRGAQHVQPH